MKGFVEFIIVSIIEVEIELLRDMKEEDNTELNTAIDELITALEY